VRQDLTAPVVGSAGSTSPDTMVGPMPNARARPDRRARPSIADPFFPFSQEIDEGREQDIRECIELPTSHLELARLSPGALHSEPEIGEVVASRVATRRIAPAAASARPCSGGWRGSPAVLDVRFARPRGYELPVAEGGR